MSLHSSLFAMILLTITFTVSAFGASTPKCSDPGTKATVVEIIMQKARSDMLSIPLPDESVNSMIRGTQIDLTGIRASDYQENISKYFCVANLEIRFPEDCNVMLDDPRFKQALLQDTRKIAPSIQLNDGVIRMPVEYTSQLTEDTKEGWIEVAGVRAVSDLIAMMGKGRFMLAAKNAESQQKPVSHIQPQQTAAVTAEEPPSPLDDQCEDLDPTVTPDILECMGRRYRSADEELNALYKSLMSRLNDNSKAQLKREQVAWVKKKETECRSAGKENDGGTAEQVTIAECFATMTEDRVEYLKKYSGK